MQFGIQADKSPLLVAAERLHLSTVDVLLRRGAKINQADKHGKTPIFIACKDYELFLFFWKHGALLTCQTTNGFTLLMQAASIGNLDTVAFLLQHGADINACTTSGNTALVFAAEAGNAEVVKYLLQHGAKLAHSSGVARKALRGAIYANDPDTVKLLLARVSAGDRNPKFLSEAVWVVLDYGILEGRLWKRNPWRMRDTIQLLLVAGAELPDHDQPGRIRLLHFLQRIVSDGVERYYLSVWEIMLAAGLNVNARGDGGQTALMIAGTGDSAVFVDLFLRHGADLGVKDDQGQTVLTMARMVNATHVISLLEHRR